MDRSHAAGASAHRQPADHSHGTPPRALRVLVVGVSWPMETFVEGLLTGLAGHGLDLTLVPLTTSLSRPAAEWTKRHRIVWAAHALPMSLRALARETTEHGVLAGAVAGGARAKRLFARDRSSLDSMLHGAWDVLYAPWINALTDRASILDTDVPVVTSCRGSLVTVAPWNPSRPAHRRALLRVFEESALVHCVSDAIVGDAVGLGLDTAKARVIRPAVDPDRFTSIGKPARDGQSTRVIGVGSLSWPKDYEHALLTIRKALDLGVDLRLDLVGEGPDRQHIVFAIDDLGLKDHVRLLGRLSPDEVAQEIRSADVFLHTSSSEGISNAVLEGMATGLPVVTTDAGGMREAVRDGVDGFVVDVRDAGAAAAALARLANEPDLRTRMGLSARQRILDDFRLDQQIDAFDALLHEAAGR